MLFSCHNSVKSHGRTSPRVLSTCRHVSENSDPYSEVSNIDSPSLDSLVRCRGNSASAAFGAAGALQLSLWDLFCIIFENWNLCVQSLAGTKMAV